MQLLDVLWAVLVLVGIERVRIVPGITATNPLDLYYMPYTHSLTAALGWSVVAAVAYKVWRRPVGARAPVVIGGAVFSHWVFDLLVHRADLPLVGNRMKVGLGLWNLPSLAFVLEAIFLFGGLIWYLNASRPARRRGGVGYVVFGVALLGVQAVTFFGAPPASAHGAAITALGAYLVLAAVAAWLEANRFAGPRAP